MLELQSIRKTFNRGTPDESVLFDDFSFTVKQGEFVSIVGSNGSGKTTLLNLISGSVSADGGKILLGGEDITAQKEFVRARRIGRVFQDPSRGTANSMTVAENMALAENKGKPYNLTAGLNKKRVEGYRDMLAPLRLGLEERMNVPVGALSGGQRQVLTLVIATMTPIDLLLLDEHTAALDPKTSEITMLLTDKIISEKKLTALMVTHNLRFAEQYGTRLCMFDKGRVVLDKAGEDKKNTSVDDLLKVFNEISIECGN
ncbi:ATP-binding cassette domain-containing protein [Candidatus Borkfalkia ceftriaxoniphila]|mgnify:FL=1|uniref:ATP-binding cassette domain-containing protein n=1 Tax=Candidatus Borkfalkia ceftriaxoniphila TaxID=2508949 RepID=A0A4V1QVD2_9FIRM|nr:ATP-binding cassette domain-containing protein [Candidatus Borkfalkia ceftriaxoniphila]RXZ62246.1 ATP-binding cassette domain-containing protein [Candidatus Borkfalkia ceftriaxoniphila]